MNTYVQGYTRRFLVKSGTFQHLFCIFIWYVIFALPFYFSFGGQKFWLKTKNEMITCNYNFTGYYAIQVNSVSASTNLQEQYSNIPGSSIGNLALASWSVNDQTESSAIQFSLSGFAAKQIIDLNLIMYYKVWIQDLKKEISASFVQNLSGDNSYTQVSGVLGYQPQSPLNNIESKDALNYPAYFANLQSATSFDALMDHVIENDKVYRLNHQSMKIESTGTGVAQRKFKIKLIKDTKVNITYYPSVLQTLKFSFSKWLAFTIIAYFVFYSLLSKLVKDGSLITKVKDQIVS